MRSTLLLSVGAGILLSGCDGCDLPDVVEGGGGSGGAVTASATATSAMTGASSTTVGSVASTTNTGGGTCGGEVTDVMTDPSHCGVCDFACPGSCQGGSCQLAVGTNWGAYALALDPAGFLWWGPGAADNRVYRLPLAPFGPSEPSGEQLPVPRTVLDMEVDDANGNPVILMGGPPVGLLFSGVSPAPAYCPLAMADCPSGTDILRYVSMPARDSYAWSSPMGGLYAAQYGLQVDPMALDWDNVAQVHFVGTTSLALSPTAVVAWAETGTQTVKVTRVGGSFTVPDETFPVGTQELANQITFADETLFWVCGTLQGGPACASPGVHCANQLSANPLDYEDVPTAYSAAPTDSIWVVQGPDPASNTDDVVYLGRSDGTLVRGPGTCGANQDGNLELVAAPGPGVWIGRILSSSLLSGAIFWSQFTGGSAGGVFVRHPDAPVLGLQ